MTVSCKLVKKKGKQQVRCTTSAAKAASVRARLVAGKRTARSATTKLRGGRARTTLDVPKGYRARDLKVVVRVGEFTLTRSVASLTRG